MRGEDDPATYVDGQGDELNSDLQTLRWQLAAREQPTSAVHDQALKLLQTAAELREVFETLTVFREVSEKELDRALARLQSVWQQARIRVALVAVLIPLPPPLPALTLEQEAHYQSVLDGLADRFDAARSHNGRGADRAAA